MFNKKTYFILLVLLVTILPSCGGEKTKPNILLITVDTLRRDHLGIYGYHRDTSPFIDHLARNGLRFEHVITPQPHTAGSHASILTSLHPLTHGLIFNGFPLSEKVQTIAEVLKKNGYYTIGTVAVSFLKGSKNFSQGFDSFSDKWEKEPGLDPKFPIPERTAQSVNKSLFKLIDAYRSHPQHKDKPLFIWVHYYDPHGPYYDKDYITFKKKRQKGTPKGVNLYDKEIRYTDDSIKALYSYLEGKGLTRRMVTCITADHGEQMGEHGYTFGHPDFYSETTFVPLVFHGHGIPKNKRVDTYVSTMDIGLSLLGTAGLTFDYPTEGIDLLNGFKNHRDREFLIIGTPNHTRSMQLLKSPFTYILNFDYHHKYWYISLDTSGKIDEKRFKPIQKNQVKKKGKTLYVRLPRTREKGRQYVVLRGDIKKNDGLHIKIKVFPAFYTTRTSLLEKSDCLDIIYPVTVLDRIRVQLQLQQNSMVDNFRYTFISGQELPQHADLRKIDNKIYKDLRTQRKKIKSNEFFNLSDDIKMEKNLAEIKKLIPAMHKYRESIYKAFNFYLEKKKCLLKGSKDKKELTEEDKKALKSLGYL